MERRQLKMLFGVLLAILGLLVIVMAVGVSKADATVTAKIINAKALCDHEINNTEWHFVINQIDTEAHAPVSIHVTWSNGQQADVPMDKFTGGTAHYPTTANLDSTVVSATAEIYAGWDGQFNLSHGPACEQPTTTTTQPSTTTTTAPSTTTTTQPVTSTTTTQPTTTTSNPTTTTTSPPRTSTTVPPTSQVTPPPPPPPSTTVLLVQPPVTTGDLPVTGARANVIGIFGFMLVLTGLSILIAARRVAKN